MTTTTTNNSPTAEVTPGIRFCVENPLYGAYLKDAFAQLDKDVVFFDKSELANSIAESPNGTLVLQSDESEFELIEVAARLKRLFGEQLQIIFLSLDYLLEDEVSGMADAFLQFPVDIDELLQISESVENVNKRVLLIDDSRLVHRTLVEPLQEAGYEVHQAFDGLEGFEKAKEVKPHVVICDIEMPRMNGFEACASIRREQDLLDIYIIMSSTLGSAANQQRGFEAGVDEYITKPVIIEELVDRIGKAFKSSGRGRESVLILEHEDVVARNIANSLSKQGFTPRNTDTVRNALRTLKRVSCDLVITRIEPSDATIIEFFDNLKALNEDRRPDVIIMTSRDSGADAKMVMNAGAVGVISKPFTMDGMLALVERALADRRTQKERAQLQRYVSKASIRIALEKSVLAGESTNARADKKQGTIFFSDIADFTSRCERYSPKEVVDQINRLFEVMTSVIIEHGGDIDKFMGDACMAFWLEEGGEESARTALRAVIDMREKIQIMNQEDPLLKDDPINIRIGVNSGEVILCDIGAADARIDLTIIGDTVNIAARLEAASKQYGIDTLISETTIQPYLDEFSGRIIDKVRVKGKDIAVACYELFGAAEAETDQIKNIKQCFDEAFQLYLDANFDKAFECFKKAEEFEARRNDDINPSRIYQKRCEFLINNAPEKWDGIWSLTEK